MVLSVEAVKSKHYKKQVCPRFTEARGTCFFENLFVYIRSLFDIEREVDFYFVT
ncbi:hypothetical protein F4694_001207 [Bacillus niacini]|uniref:Uncharacterized protein n=1 Tax=Neobacillus niacini TaxID=86668 RepID=A0A852T742_9BACI|nr:hypothetical protein [Neobacillus niacini]